MLWRAAVLAGSQELRSAFTFKVPLPGLLAKDAQNGQSPASLAWCAGGLPGSARSSGDRHLRRTRFRRPPEAFCSARCLAFTIRPVGLLDPDLGANRPHTSRTLDD